MALALAGYHPKLRESVLAAVPDTAGDSAFLADGELSDAEIAALDRAQSVFGLEPFYRAWELDELPPNHVHAVLYILTFYDPYTTVHDVAADPDDPDAEGAALARTLDDFGVSDEDGGDWWGSTGVRLLRGMPLLHLAHHAKVQADALSPCDLRDFTEEELIALGVNAYNTPAHNFVASARLTDEMLAASIDYSPRGYPPRGDPSRMGWRPAKVLIRPGEVLSPFTHAMRAIGGPPSERGLEPCLEAVKRIVEWDAKRYDHFLEHGWQELYPFFRDIFPSYTRRNRDILLISHVYPTWVWFLVDLSGGQDKSIRLMNQFRALNLPAIRELRGIFFDETAAEASTAIRGVDGVLLSPYGLYLHRNIGFSREDYQADPDDRIRVYSFPERCRIERIAPGFIEWREDTPSRRYLVWKRNPNLSEVRSYGYGSYDGRVNLVYACD